MPQPSMSIRGAVRTAPVDGRTDPLTGAAARLGLVERLAAPSAGGAERVLLFVDLDGVRRLNGRLGRWVSDEVLRAVARRLDGAAGPGGLVARLGGDRFAVLASEGEGAERRAWADSVATAIAAPLEVGGLVLRLTGALVLVRLETAVAGIDGGEALLDRAELAVDEIRETGTERVLEVDVLPPERTPADLAVARRLVQAVEDGEVVAVYQPVVDLADGGVVGAEALARWPGAPAGYEGPADFLALAAAIGLMPRITDALLAQVCRDFAAGPPARAGLWVSLNLGAGEATGPDVVDRIHAALTASDLAPDRLVVEVSERLVPDPVAARALAGIADLGVRLAIDDFGSGWSSLAQLRRLPIDVVKVDRSLVAIDGHGDVLLLLATASMAEALDLEVVAEGIETEEELQLARIAGIGLGQGFLWGAGGPVEDLAAVPARQPKRRP